ncbi:MAG: hypothetical protein J7641_16450 [Cyanobacteria bacterium SID2]|nr:hypothetical protein [Cyanobacteria bacterium SID2]MBP0004853.1 hypothetical protein [Cyanobacteria bacterium SBC]
MTIEELKAFYQKHAPHTLSAVHLLERSDIPDRDKVVIRANLERGVELIAQRLSAAR